MGRFLRALNDGMEFISGRRIVDVRGKPDWSFFDAISRARDYIRNDEDSSGFAKAVGIGFLDSYSQLFQDLWVLSELRAKKSGYFVEFGAYDGVTYSNTYLLERRPLVGAAFWRSQMLACIRAYVLLGPQI